MVQDNNVIGLPSQRQWPVSLRPRKNQWPLALLRHITFNSIINWPDYQKQKKAFGMPEDSSWYLFSITKEVFDSVLLQSKKSSEWFFRYASAKVPWTLKALDFNSITSNTCEVMSAHCIREYIQQTQTKTSVNKCPSLTENTSLAAENNQASLT